MEMLIDECMILDYGKILTHRPTKEILDNFHRFRFNSEDDIAKLKDKRMWNTERVDGAWESYSFCPKDEVLSILESFHIENIEEQPLSLEDAFIGLTGKY